MPPLLGHYQHTLSVWFVKKRSKDTKHDILEKSCYLCIYFMRRVYTNFRKYIENSVYWMCIVRWECVWLHVKCIFRISKILSCTTIMCTHSPTPSFYINPVQMIDRGVGRGVIGVLDHSSVYFKFFSYFFIHDAIILSLLLLFSPCSHEGQRSERWRGGNGVYLSTLLIFPQPMLQLFGDFAHGPFHDQSEQQRTHECHGNRPGIQEQKFQAWIIKFASPW